MNKVQQKLIELDYKLEKVEYIGSMPMYSIYTKYFEYCYIKLWFIFDDKRVLSLVKFDTAGLAYQEELDNLQQAFNIRNKDLEILRKISNE